MAKQNARERKERSPQAPSMETKEQALKRMGFPSPTDLALFPWMISVVMPGFGQIINGRYVQRQWIKGFLFSWFFWYFVLMKPIYPAAAILFIASAVDFVVTRRRYNRRLAAAKQEIDYAENKLALGS